MDASDLTRIVKLLGMTGSEHDGEALNAIRLANKLIREGKTNWAEVMAPKTAKPDLDGYLRGYQDGASVGRNNGYREGVEAGKADGYRNGEKAGYTNGHREGKTAGYRQAQLDGINSPQATGAREKARQEGFQDGYLQGLAERKTAPAGSLGPGQANWLDLCQQMLDRNSPRVNEWEREFLETYIHRQWANPSPKQRAVLESIARKVGVKY